VSAFGREFVTAIATEGGSPPGATEAQWPACTSVTVARHEAIHLVSSAIVKRCEPVNITRLR